MKSILKQYEDSKIYNDILTSIKQGKQVEIAGQKSYIDSNLISYINENVKGQKIYVVSNEIKAREIYEKLKNNKNVVLMPKKETILYDYYAESKNIPYDRIDTLNKIVSKKDCLIIVSIETLLQKMISKKVLYQNVLDLKIGSILDLGTIKEKLIALGYVRQELIETRGQFSVRGDIVDVAINDKEAYRIELWGDEVDSIRQIDLVSQRSIKNVSNIKILPAHEYLLENPRTDAILNIKRKYNTLSLKTPKQEEVLNKDIASIESGGYISKIDKYFNEFYSNEQTFLNYLKKDSLLILDEYKKIQNRINTINLDNQNIEIAMVEKNKIAPEILDTKKVDEFIDDIKGFRKTYIIRDDNFLKLDDGICYELNIKPKNYYKEQFPDFIKEIKDNLGKYNIYLFAEDKATKQLAKMLEDSDIVYSISSEYIKTKNSINYVTILPGQIAEGFIDEDTKTIMIDCNVFLTHKQIKKKKAQTFQKAQKVVYADLKVGDIVVHENHGIGVYIGINRIEINNVTKDYIKLRYKDNDILYVPTSQMDKVRKYIGSDESHIKLSSLSSKEWQKTKTRVKNNLREIAKDLLELYAKREKTKGFAFSADNVWQKEFEDEFPYEETQDQERCIAEVKSDMEMAKPMDRLLCGDVGFGKTEVALRAAFKATQDSKQVAYVAPTTVLANQQYNEFKKRFSKFPINIELLNRYKTPKEQKKVIEGLKRGEVDIVIGTHRLFSKDVDFSNLGLLIIDEEQRFGVKHKEKIKKLKQNIDVLTMSATPIPRTLHMGMVGIRDMSVIYTPPQDRKPIQTYVMEYDADIIKEAMTKELDRNGQVFYLFNRIDGMESKLNELKSMMPDAKIDYANGRMSGEEIENKMQDFIDKKIDILLCTTILEAGIDIPNANTLIIENADRMGLSQLYQIRGRVGRSSRQAFAYITYKKEKVISEDADKRLKALKEFTEFGSGYKIAMRDLEIRGAGSLVGEIQSGHLEEVGYETYVRLLDEVIKEIKENKKIDETQDVLIDIDVSSYIPDTYIDDEKLKIDIYQKIAEIKSEEDILNVTDEIIDRFGEVPHEVLNLIQIAKLRYLCNNIKIIKLQVKSGFAVISFEDDGFLFDFNYIQQKFQDKIKFSNNKVPKVTIALENKRGEKMLSEITNIIMDLNNNYLSSKKDNLDETNEKNKNKNKEKEVVNI